MSNFFLARHYRSASPRAEKRRACGIFCVLSREIPLAAMRQAAGTCGFAVRISREIFAKSLRIRCLCLLTVNFLFVIKLYIFCEPDMAASASGFCVLSGAKCVRRFRAGVPAACLTAARGILRRSAQKPPQSRLHLRTPTASVSGAQYKPYTSESFREG